MSDAFIFLPRQLGRKTARQPTSKGKEKATEPLLDAPIVNDTRSNGRSSPTPRPNAAPVKRSERSQPTQSDEELVMLVWLTLSDYAVWSDPDLRRMVSYSAEGCAYVVPSVQTLTNFPGRCQPGSASEILQRNTEHEAGERGGRSRKGPSSVSFRARVIRRQAYIADVSFWKFSDDGEL